MRLTWLVLAIGCGGGKDEGGVSDTGGGGPGPTPTPPTSTTDGDGDGFANIAAGGDDCDDGNAAINPDADEVCDGVDNDCDGTSDLDPVEPVLYADNDEDGFGDPDDGVGSCFPMALRVEDSTDCDDTEADVHPGHDEWCNDRDDDCDPATDEGGAVSVGGVGAYATVQDAVDAAVNGDVIDVCAGTYQESVIASKSLQWVGHGGRDLVFLDGRGLAPVLRLNGGTEFHIEGITLENGLGDNGGCLAVTVASDLYLDDARLTTCTAAFGGAIYFDGSRIFATGTEIVDSSASEEGGGIWGGFNAEIHLTDCAVDRDSADNAGGVFGLQSTDVTATDSTFDDDTATTNGGGLALFQGSTLVMTGGSILRAGAKQGGGVLLDDSTITASGVDFGASVDDNTPNDVFVVDVAAAFSWDGVASPACDPTGCI